MKILVSQSSNFDFKSELYEPLKRASEAVSASSSLKLSSDSMIEYNDKNDSETKAVSEIKKILKD